MTPVTVLICTALAAITLAAGAVFLHQLDTWIGARPLRDEIASVRRALTDHINNGNHHNSNHEENP